MDCLCGSSLLKNASTLPLNLGRWGVELLWVVSSDGEGGGGGVWWGRWIHSYECTSPHTDGHTAENFLSTWCRRDQETVPLVFFYFLNSLFPRSQKWFLRHFLHLIGKYLVFKIGLIFSFYAPEVQFLKVRKGPSGGVVLSFLKFTNTVKTLVTINHINY